MLLLLMGWGAASEEEDPITGAGLVPVIYAERLRTVKAEAIATVEAERIKTIYGR